MRLEVVNSKEKSEMVDRLRYAINNVEYDSSNFYINCIKQDKIYVLACFIEGELVSGMYISNQLNSLYIEKLFVKENYRKQGIASYMINYVINNKDYFEDLFHKKIEYSKLEPNSNLTVDIYKKFGYRGPDSLNIMKKRI